MVVKRKITTKTPFEMALVKDNSVIQTRPANATDDAFDIGILPRAPRCAGTIFHSQTAHAFRSSLPGTMYLLSNLSQTP